MGREASTVWDVQRESTRSLLSVGDTGAGRDGPRGWGWVVRLGIVQRKIMARVDHCRQEPTVIGSAPDLDEEERGAGWKRWQGAGGPGVALRQCPSLRRRIDPGTAACRKEAWR